MLLYLRLAPSAGRMDILVHTAHSCSLHRPTCLCPGPLGKLMKVGEGLAAALLDYVRCVYLLTHHAEARGEPGRGGLPLTCA